MFHHECDKFSRPIAKLSWPKDNNQPGAPIISSRWIKQENDCEKMKARIVARDYEGEALFVDTPTIDKTSLI